MPRQVTPQVLKPSKSQRKREMNQLQDLGEVLVTLRDNEFARVKLPERLHDAIVACRKIKAHEAKRRQLQYVGRVMRELDDLALSEVFSQLKKHCPNALAKAIDTKPSGAKPESSFPFLGDKAQ